jgi:hypothetical protein
MLLVRETLNLCFCDARSGMSDVQFASGQLEKKAGSEKFHFEAL